MENRAVGTAMPTILVIFGATGDLARTKLIPALFHLYDAGLLPPLWQVVGFSRRELSDASYRDFVGAVLREHGITGASVADFQQRFSYRSGLFEDAAGYAELARLLGRHDEQWRTCANKLFYLAVPPRFYSTIFEHLSESGLTQPCGPDEGWTRVIVEKPFGKDLATAQELDAMLGKLFKEEQIYRIDHYLGKDTARNILAFRFSNAFLEPAWNSRSIAGVHIHFPESAGLEGRGGFYDGVGALRDVGQNHMLQLLALFLMENPGSFDADSVRRERTKVLEALEVMDDQDIVRQTMRAQYEGYRSVAGVAPDSQTETFFRIQTHVRSPRWRGVPIYLESGKGLDGSKFEIVVQFRHMTPCLCPPGRHVSNELRYRIQPDEGVYTSFWVKKPGPAMVIEEKEFSFDYHQAYQQGEFLDAYVKLLLDAIAGDQTLFVSTDEILASWRFIDPIVRAWQGDAVPLLTYPLGSSRDVVVDQVPASVLPLKQVGYVGLGKMGAAMVARLLEHGWRVVATDSDEAARGAVEAEGASTVRSAAEVVRTLRAQGSPDEKILVWLMVPHQVVDTVLQELIPHLQPGDTVIDGGNSLYTDSVRRYTDLSSHGVHFLDVGVSGGPTGARQGACLMVGGDRAVYREYAGLFSDLAVAGGYDYMGEAGAGHFVKMVHNGIEYGMMQALGEGFAVLRRAPHGFDLERIAHVFNHGSVIESQLVGWLRDAYAAYGSDLEAISGSVEHTGEGAWTVATAQELGVPVAIIEGALRFREASQHDPSYTGKVVSALRGQFGGHSVASR